MWHFQELLKFRFYLYCLLRWSPEKDKYVMLSLIITCMWNLQNANLSPHWTIIDAWKDSRQKHVSLLMFIHSFTLTKYARRIIFQNSILGKSILELLHPCFQLVILYWSIANYQCCDSFRYTVEQLSHIFTPIQGAPWHCWAPPSLTQNLS